MEKNVLWSKDYSIKNYDNNQISKDTDILIIGGGITGLTTSYFLKGSNYKVTLIDKGKIGCGITFKTTGKVSYLQGDIYSKLNKLFNKKISKLYFNSQIDGIKIIKDIVSTNNIDCDLEKVLSIVFTLEDKNIKKINEEKDILKKFGVKVNDVKDNRIKGGISVDDTYVFNPIRYINSLVKILEKKINIYENVLANDIKKVQDYYLVSTSSGVIKIKHM